MDIDAEVRRRIPAGPDALRAAELFGLGAERLERLYEGFHLGISAGQIVAVIGPSGAGKSVLLSEVSRRVTGAVWLGDEALGRCNLPAVAVLKGSAADFARRLEVLSRCGLAEAWAMVTPAKFLSGGQRYRLAFAEAMFSAERRKRGGLVIADEFASCLDDQTARSLCAQARKLISNSRLALLVATPRGDLMDVLQPDQLIVKPLAEPARLVAPHRRRAKPKRRRLRIVRGTIHDYEALSQFHYLCGRPAAHKRVYTIRAPAAGVRRGYPSIAAVCVVSPPLCQCRGRNVATGGRYCGSDRARGMVLLNAEMEWLSRVVVHPAYRGEHLAVRLVRHAVRRARTPWMEALAVMGSVHPFFELAGMACFGQFQGRRCYSYYLARTPKAASRRKHR